MLLQGKFYLSTARPPCAEFNRIDTRARYEGAYFLSLKERKSPQDDHLPVYAFGRCLINFKIYFTCIDISQYTLELVTDAYGILPGNSYAYEDIESTFLATGIVFSLI